MNDKEEERRKCNKQTVKDAVKQKEREENEKKIVKPTPHAKKSDKYERNIEPNQWRIYREI